MVNRFLQRLKRPVQTQAQAWVEEAENRLRGLQSRADSESWDGMAMVTSYMTGLLANKSNVGHTHDHTEITDFNSSVDARISAQAGSANGLAQLDAGGKVPSAQLPSFVDDVLEFTNLAALPATGDTGKIYVTLDTNLVYRWSGSVYIAIAPGAVASVYGRSGNVIATAGDYNSNQVTNSSSVTGATVSAALNTLLSRLAAAEAAIAATAIRKTVEYSATTDANGDITITYGAGTFTKTPWLAINPLLNSTTQEVGYTIRSQSNTGVTIRFWKSTAGTSLNLGIITTGLSYVPIVTVGAGVTINVMAIEPL